MTRNTSSAVRPLDDDEKGSHIVSTPGGPQSVLVVNESGLYGLILASRKPAAKEFRKWVTSTVLPSLRRDGIYINGQELPIPDGMTMADLLAQMEEVQAKVNAIHAARLLASARHQEEKQARSDAFWLLKHRRLMVHP